MANARPSLREILNKVSLNEKSEIVSAIVSEWSTRARAADILRPHRAAHFLAQVANESGGFSVLVEQGGDAYANRLYDTRTDLGNTPERDGDGALYKGRGLIQLTGKYNYKKFGDIVAAQYGLPNNYFVNHPEAAADPRYSLAFALAFWSDLKLNRYADENNIEMITRRVNGGLNGYTTRLEYYTRLGLTMLGFEFNKAGIENFQTLHRLTVDGISGPKTRASIHLQLLSIMEYDYGTSTSSSGPVPVEAVGDREDAGGSRKRGGLFAAIVGIIAAIAAAVFGSRKGS